MLLTNTVEFLSFHIFQLLEKCSLFIVAVLRIPISFYKLLYQDASCLVWMYAGGEFRHVFTCTGHTGSISSVSSDLSYHKQDFSIAQIIILLILLILLLLVFASKIYLFALGFRLHFGNSAISIMKSGSWLVFTQTPCSGLLLQEEQKYFIHR